MSFEFRSAGKTLDIVPFRTIDRSDETPMGAYEYRKLRVMEWLIAFSSSKRLGLDFNPTKDSYPDATDMAVIRTNDPERWNQLEQNAAADLTHNGFIAPLTEPIVSELSKTEVPVLRSPRPSNETLLLSEQTAA